MRRIPKKLNKTETFIKTNRNKKIGLFLPSLTEYESLNKEAKREWQLAIRRYNSRGLDTRAKGFWDMKGLAKTTIKAPKRMVRAYAADANLQTEYAANNNQFFGSNKSPHKNDYAVRQLNGFLETPKNHLTLDPNEVAEKLTDFDYYEVEGGFVVYDTTRSPSKRTKKVGSKNPRGTTGALVSFERLEKDARILCGLPLSLGQADDGIQ